MPDTIASAEARLLQALRALGSPERAEWEKRYQKSRWEHWGVSLPNMDVAMRETLGDLSQDEALALCRRLWREPVWDLKIVAGRILARKSIAPDAKVLDFVTERMADLDGWAVADNLASVASRCLIEDPGRLDAVESWIENPICGRGARRWSSPSPGRRRNAIPNGCSAGPRDWPRIANGSSRRRSAGGCANCRSATPSACAGF
jgi:hypothetical protein